jgi:hypothetical protein
MCSNAFLRQPIRSRYFLKSRCIYTQTPNYTASHSKCVFKTNNQKQIFLKKSVYIHIHQTTRRHIPEDSYLLSHCSEDIISQSYNLVTSPPATKSLHKTRTRNSTPPRTTNALVTILKGPHVFPIPLEDVLIWN